MAKGNFDVGDEVLIRGANWDALLRPRNRKQRSCRRNRTSPSLSSFAATFCLNTPRIRSFSGRAHQGRTAGVSWLALPEQALSMGRGCS